MNNDPIKNHDDFQNPDTSKPEPNHLIHEKSPYLIQHAYNPVDWYPWGEEAIKKALQENKPILLSIGYSTCHWCHVMEEESFSDAQIATLMNRYFVCIKVDREERPDLDKIYITAVSALTGSAGWPLNVFLTPKLKPFFGGTYFPPNPRLGTIAWPVLISHIGESWQDSTMRDKIIASSEDIMQSVSSYLQAKVDQSHTIDGLLEKAVAMFEDRFDFEQGGFSKAPKFPMPVNQSFLLAYYLYARNKTELKPIAAKALDMSEKTLAEMSKGGIFDHVGGGFHRYSTDEYWHVPHFEKMLYDNAQLIENYLIAYQITHKPEYKDVAIKTLDYVLRDLTDPNGGFYSAEDADSSDINPAQVSADSAKNKKREGAFYVWTQTELQSVLTSLESDIWCARYGIDSQGNAKYDPHQEFVGKNICFEAKTIDQIAGQFSRSEREIIDLLIKIQGKLFNVRDKRPRPHRDEKILTGWNGLMIQSLAKAYQILVEERYYKAARKAAEFILQHMYDEENNRLFRRWMAGDRKIPAMVSDYAFLIQALVDMYETDFDLSWLEWSKRLANEMIDHFYDVQNSGFYMTRVDQDRYISIRVKEEEDNVIPSANSIAVHALNRLHAIIPNDGFARVAEKTLQAGISLMSHYPGVNPMMLKNVIYRLSKPIQIIMVGPMDHMQTKQMLQAAWNCKIDKKSLILLDSKDQKGFFADQLPFARSMTMNLNKPTAYVCTHNACREPISDIAQFEDLLAALEMEI